MTDIPETNTLLGWAAAAITAMLGGIVKHQNTQIQELRIDLQDQKENAANHRVNIATNMATKDDIEALQATIQNGHNAVIAAISNIASGALGAAHKPQEPQQNTTPRRRRTT